MSSNSFIGKTTKSVKKTVGKVLEEAGPEILGAPQLLGPRILEASLKGRGTPDDPFNRSAFIEEVRKSGISKASQEETIGMLTGGGLLKDQARALDFFRRAKEGTDPKFKSRKATEALFQNLVERPDATRLRGSMNDFNAFIKR